MYPCINMAYCCWIGALDIYIRDLLRITEPRLAFKFCGSASVFFSFALWRVTSVILVATFSVFVFAWGM